MLGVGVASSLGVGSGVGVFSGVGVAVIAGGVGVAEFVYQRERLLKTIR